MKIVVDTNIIFSALVNTDGSIGDLLFNSEPFFRFYSCSYMRYEIEKHWGKLLRASNLSDAELKESQYRLFKKISFLDEELIPPETWLLAKNVVSDIDINDIDFVATSEFLNGTFRTGDKELYNGLRKKGFFNVMNTRELLSIREKERSDKNDSLT